MENITPVTKVSRYYIKGLKKILFDPCIKDYTTKDNFIFYKRIDGSQPDGKHYLVTAMKGNHDLWLAEICYSDNNYNINYPIEYIKMHWQNDYIWKVNQK